MKKILLSAEETGFKANLHCHTTVSDGDWTPERVKEEYKKRGYSIVAYTDHDLMISHSELNDEKFLAMNGYEVEINEPAPKWGLGKVCHMCFVATTPEIKNHAFWNKEALNYTWGNAHELAKHAVNFDGNEPDFWREYSPECISEMMKKAREKGFFVTYNHPVWSMENYTNYTRYHGMHAMEIVNYSCVASGYDEYNGRVYDDMLRAGERIFCIAADDNHNKKDGLDSFGGFTVIKAKKLDYALIGQALLNGCFYASEGPEIHSLWVEDGVVYITCSPVATVSMQTGILKAGIVYPNGNEPLTQARFVLDPDQKYFRLTVTDDRGKRAFTNAYFIDEL